MLHLQLAGNPCGAHPVDVCPSFCHHWFCLDNDNETRKGSPLRRLCSSAQCPGCPALCQAFYSSCVPSAKESVRQQF